MLYITNAFSLNMLQGWFATESTAEVTITKESTDSARRIIENAERGGKGIISAVGHAETAAIFSDVLGREIEMNRMNVDMTNVDVLLVGQYTGPRLPEGATTLPEGASIHWYAVTLPLGTD